MISLKDCLLDDVFRQFCEKGRYNTRLALKRGIETSWVRADDISDLILPDNELSGAQSYVEQFFVLLEQTTARDGFHHNSFEYYRNFLQVLEKHHAG